MTLAALAGCTADARLDELADKELQFAFFGERRERMSMSLIYSGECRTLDDDVVALFNGAKLKLQDPGGIDQEPCGGFFPTRWCDRCEFPSFTLELDVDPSEMDAVRVELRDSSQRVVLETRSPYALRTYQPLQALDRLSPGDTIRFQPSIPTDRIVPDSVSVEIRQAPYGLFSRPKVRLLDERTIEFTLPNDLTGSASVEILALLEAEVVACENLRVCDEPHQMRIPRRFQLEVR